jgi:hypothetical protein
LAGKPRLVPNSFLEHPGHPGYFGNQEDVTWKLASDLPGALVLAHCREQHELALQICAGRDEGDGPGGALPRGW